MRGGAVQSRWLAVVATAAACALAVGCGSSNDDKSSSSSGSAAAKSGDTGATITMWTRAATQTQSERFVKAYNASHKNQVKLTVIPTDNYQARVAAAAGGKNLPDLFAADVIYAPNYVSRACGWTSPTRSTRCRTRRTSCRRRSRRAPRTARST